MKVILTGASGFIGAEVLRQCLRNPSITSLVALSRRELLVAPDPKLKTVLVENWEAYEPSVLRELEGAEACIWTLGAKTADVEVQKKVTLDYTIAAAETFSQLPSSSSPMEKATPRPLPFRFVFTSGILAVRDQSKTLLFASGARHIKGDAENKLLDFTAEHKEAFDAIVVRPGAVLANGGRLAGVAACVGAPAVSVQGLAAVMVELALKGADEKVWENKELAARGKELLKAQEGM